jgi:hypothetical protein
MRVEFSHDTGDHRTSPLSGLASTLDSSTVYLNRFRFDGDEKQVWTSRPAHMPEEG